MDDWLNVLDAGRDRMAPILFGVADPPRSACLGDVSADGRPEQVELQSPSGSPRLDSAALETVRRWKFVPARQDNRPIAAWVLVPISFRLQG